MFAKALFDEKFLCIFKMQYADCLWRTRKKDNHIKNNSFYNSSHKTGHSIKRYEI